MILITNRTFLFISESKTNPHKLPKKIRKIINIYEKRRKHFIMSTFVSIQRYRLIFHCTINILNEKCQANPILLALNISSFNNILNALQILWENQFDQTALMLIIHSYHKDLLLSHQQQASHEKALSEIFKGNCLSRTLVLASRRCQNQLHQSGKPEKSIKKYIQFFHFSFQFSLCPFFRMLANFCHWSSPQTQEWERCKSENFWRYCFNISSDFFFFWYFSKRPQYLSPLWAARSRSRA